MGVGDRNEEVIELLLSKGADPLVKGNDGQTPLSLAMDIKREGILQLLHSHIDPNDEDAHGWIDGCYLNDDCYWNDDCE